MDAYAFVRETDSAGLEALAALVGDEPGVRTFLPLVGAYAAYVKVSDPDPAVVRRALTRVADIVDVLGVETLVGSSPAARGELFGDTTRVSLSPARLADRLTASTLDIWDLLPPPPPPPPMPTDGGVGELVGFVHLSVEPGAATEVYVQVSALPGVVGVAVTSGLDVGVFVEVTADDEHALAYAAENVASVAAVTDVAVSVGVSALGLGLGRLER